MTVTRLTQSISTLPTTTAHFIREAREELRKVTWPSRQQTIRYTIIVIVASLIVAAVTGGIDYLLTILVKTLITRT